MVFLKKKTVAYAAAVAACGWLSIPATWAFSGAEADAAVKALKDSPQYQKAVGFIQDNHGSFVDLNISMQQIAAPPFGEKPKAEAFLKLMKEAGLPAEIDEEGNVLALWKGTSGEARTHAVIAHLDTVFKKDTDLKIKKDGSKINAPGIADNTRGVASMLMYVKAMKQAGIQTRDNILFVASVGEEGLGDLRGVKYLFNKGKYKGQIASAIIVDGSDPDRVTAQAAGSKRYEVRFKGPGGHSYKAFGMVNPAFALGHAIDQFGKLSVPQGTTYSVGVLGGGTSVNAIPDDVWMLVDMRSSSMKDLAALEKDFLDILKKSQDHENAARSTKSGEVKMSYKLVGDRPAGATADSERLVQVGLAAVRSQGWEAKIVSSSTDANVPMSLGIPAIAIASGSGGNAHSLHEFLDTEEGVSMRSVQMPLLTILDAAGMALPK
jgi:acetylornithine deacetylase/succinyl-diaminopimelate desuccinylase-like protein